MWFLIVIGCKFDFVRIHAKIIAKQSSQRASRKHESPAWIIETKIIRPIAFLI